MSGAQRARLTRLKRALLLIVVTFGLAFAIGYAGLGAYHMLPGDDGRNLAGHRFGNDFAGFYAAGSLAAAGVADLAYDESVHRAEASRITRVVAADLPWFYPPVFFLALEPLAQLSYRTAYVVWSCLAIAALLTCAVIMRISLPLVVLVLLMPATVSGLLAGQNAAFVAAVLGIGFALLPGRPMLSGAILGLLVFKPHLAVLIPIALMAAGHGRALATAALSGVTLLALSLARHGWEAWAGFLSALPRASGYLADGSAPWSKMVTPYAALRDAGMAHEAALMAQMVIALATVLAVVWICRRSALIELQGSAVAAATLLTTPYALFYDAAVLAPLAVWFWTMGARNALSAGEGALLSVMWIAPVLFWQIAAQTGWQFWPVLLAGLMAMVVRRVDRTTLTPARSR